MWSGAFTHVMLFVIVALLISTMLTLNQFGQHQVRANAENGAAMAVVKAKMSAVEAAIASNNDTAYNHKDATEALIAAERVAAQYQVLKLLDLPIDSQQQQHADKLVADIRANYRAPLDDDRQFYAAT